MHSATRLLFVTLTSIVMALFPVNALAEPQSSESDYGLVAGQQTTTPPPSGAATTAPTVDLDRPETEADRQEDRRKLVMGITSVVLVGVVIWGRSIRRKKAKK